MGQKISRFLLFIPALLFAGPPMLSNDPYAPNKGMFEINFASEYEIRGDTKAIVAPIFDINYGAMQNLQLTVEGGYITENGTNDFSALEISFKYLFYHNEWFDIAINPAYESYPINTVFNNGTVINLNFPMNFTINEAWNIVADIGYVWQQKEGNDHFEFGSYTQYSSGNYSLFLEIFMEEAKNLTDIFTLINLGYTYSFNNNLTFMISAGKEIKAEEERAYIGYLGLQVSF